MKNTIADMWIPVLLGILGFLMFTGGGCLWPTSWEWLMSLDDAQHYTAWVFFRDSPWAEFPLGANPADGGDISSSVVYCDTVPLLTIPFKFFGSLLPPHFQFYGLFIFSVFLLQAFFGWALLLRLTHDKVISALGTCLLIWSPILLQRLDLRHDALMAQWVILAAIYLYLEPRFRPSGWLALMACTVLIHAYLLAMIFFIWIADNYRRGVTTQTPWKRLAGHAAILFGMLIFIMWTTGYFMVNGGFGTGGFGFYRANLLTLINPLDKWSIILPALPITEGDYEGFDYPGAGFLLLILVVIVLYVRGRRPPLPPNLLRPLIVVSALTVLFALSNHIALGKWTIFSYWIPDTIRILFLDPFRSSGRFIWVPTYLVFAGVIYYLSHTLPRRYAIALLLGAALLQITDLSKAAGILRNVRIEDKWDNPLKAPFWDQAAQHYTRVVCVNTLAIPPHWLELGYFAASHHLTINGAYLSRFDPKKVREAQDKVTRDALAGNFDPHTLYVFNNDGLWEDALLQSAWKKDAYIVDGLQVLAPGWTGPTEKIGLHPAPYVEKLTYHLGTKLSFTEEGGASPYWVNGWAQCEATGTWTDGSDAILYFVLDKIPSDELVIEFTARPYLAMGTLKNQIVDVSVNGQFLTHLVLQEEKEAPYKIMVPSTLVKGAENHLQLDFHISNPTSPAEVFESLDSRKLGFFISTLTITAK
jgi:hypothetical protein